MDLIATGVVEDVMALQTSSRIEVRVDRVFLGDRGYGGETLSITSGSGVSGGSAEAAGFREGARYEMYLQDEGGGWTTNVCLGTHELEESPQTVASGPGAEAPPDPPIMP